MPGLIYTSFLIERAVGPISLIGAFVGNSVVSLATTLLYHRKIGFKEVMKRGRMSNNNGNIVMYFSTLYAALLPNYYFYKGRSALTTIPFWFIMATYGILYFTNHHIL